MSKNAIFLALGCLIGLYLLVTVNSLIKTHHAHGLLGDGGAEKNQAMVSSSLLSSRSDLSPAFDERAREKFMEMLSDKAGEEMRRLMEHIHQEMEAAKVNSEKIDLLMEWAKSVDDKLKDHSQKLDDTLSKMLTMKPHGEAIDLIDLPKDVQNIFEKLGLISNMKELQEELTLRKQGKEVKVKHVPDVIPKPNTPIEKFIRLLQMHINGDITHDALEKYLGFDEAGTLKHVLEEEEKKKAERQRLQEAIDSLGGATEILDILAYHQGAFAKLPKHIMEILQSQDKKARPMSQIKHAVLVGPRCVESSTLGKFELRECGLGGPFQAWEYTSKGMFRGGFDEFCIDGSKAKVGDSPVTAPCDEKNNGQVWEHVIKGRWNQAGYLRNKQTKLCLSAGNAAPPHKTVPIKMAKCTEGCQQLFIISLNRTMAKDLPKPDPKKAPPLGTIVPNHTHRPKGERILCWIMTNPNNHATKVMAVNQTWGAECDIILYMTTRHDPALNTVVLPLGEKEDREFLWRKSMIAWTDLYTHYLDKADWFMRADDDTYVNMDNLRSFLSDYKSDDLHYFGRRLMINKADFFSGGGTNILSAGAIKKLGDEVRKNATGIFGVYDTFADDLEIAVSLKKIGVVPEDTRDSMKRERFHVLNIMEERLVTREDIKDYWYWDFSYYKPQEGLNASSPDWIATHYVTPEDILTLDDLHRLKCEGAGKYPWEA